MSVITVFTINAKENLITALEKTGALKKNDTYKTLNYKKHPDGTYEAIPTERLNCTVELPKLWPEDWATYSEELYQHGIIDFSPKGPSYENCMKHAVHFVNIPETKEHPIYISFAKKDSIYGYYTRNKNHDADSSEFVPFTDDQLSKIKNIADKMFNGYKLNKNGEYQRELIDEEKERLKFYRITASLDGTNISWHRNYATGYDSSIADYIIHALPNVSVHFVETIETDVIYSGYSKNGKLGENQAI